MNIRGGGKQRIDRKREELKIELLKQNPNKYNIKRLKESIQRNKNISKLICKKRRWKKQSERQERN